ncbi:hypothetical protein AB0O31_32940 [Kitasatospora cineracea]|uniref:hypothetical protein n=1 Tax=Kitasatospora cineracea TaxID=88074 RepID=UPI00342AF294
MHHLATAAASGTTRLSISVPILLAGLVVLLVWKGGLRGWHAALCAAAGLALADSGMGGPARGLMSGLFGWIGGLHL